MPEDKKPIKKKPATSTLKQLLPMLLSPMQAPIAGGILGEKLVKKGVNTALDRMSNNLHPYGYHSREGSSMVRGFKSVVLNKKEGDRAYTEEAIKNNKELGENALGNGRGMDAVKVRLDLLNMLANKKQKYNNIVPSEFIPLDYKKGKKYVKSSAIDEIVLKNLALEGNKTYNINDLKQELDRITATRTSKRKPTQEELEMLKISPFYTPQEKVVGEYGNLVSDPVMGDATYNVGEDEKGNFISYRDTWDLNPSQGGSAEQQSTASPNSIKGLLEKGLDLGKKVASGLLKKYSSAPEIYGRIYFDKKTGKRLQ